MELFPDKGSNFATGKGTESHLVNGKCYKKGWLAWEHAEASSRHWPAMVSSWSSTKLRRRPQRVHVEENRLAVRPLPFCSNVRLCEYLTSHRPGLFSLTDHCNIYLWDVLPVRRGDFKAAYVDHEEEM